MIVDLFAKACSYSGGGFFGLTHWYQYLPGATDSSGACQPQLSSLSDIWLVVAAIIDILLKIAALAAFAMIIYCGVTYMTSMGDAEDTVKARKTIINALVGLILSVMAAVLVSYLATNIG